MVLSSCCLPVQRIQLSSPIVFACRFVGCQHILKGCQVLNLTFLRLFLSRKSLMQLVEMSQAAKRSRSPVRESHHLACLSSPLRAARLHTTSLSPWTAQPGDGCVAARTLRHISVPRSLMKELYGFGAVIRKCDGVYHVSLSTLASQSRYFEWGQSLRDADPWIDVLQSVAPVRGVAPLAADAAAVLQEACAIAHQYQSLRAADFADGIEPPLVAAARYPHHELPYFFHHASTSHRMLEERIRQPGAGFPAINRQPIGTCLVKLRMSICQYLIEFPVIKV